VSQRTIHSLLGVLLAFLVATRAEAQSVEQFYTGKTLTFYIGFSVGGGGDVYGRLVARHIGKFILGQPTVVPVNMGGAGGLSLMNWLDTAAPKDGSAIGTVNRGIVFLPLVGAGSSALFDPREFTWIGNATDEVLVCVAMARTGITTFAQTLEQELIVGSTGPGAGEYDFPRLVSAVLGAQFRSISGYAGGNEINLAMERGEVDGRCGWSWSSVRSTRPHWLDEGSINILLQLALRKHPDLPDVPLVMDFAETDEQRQVLRLIMMRVALGRPFLAPPGIPADRAAALRTAFDVMVADAAFLAEAERLRLEINPASGADVEALLAEAYATPPHIIERARESVR